MEIKIGEYWKNGVRIIKFPGLLCQERSDVAAVFENHILKISHVGRFVFDFKEVGHLDDIAASEFIAAFSKIQKAEGRLVIARPQQHIAEKMRRLLGYPSEQILPFTDTLASAVKVARKRKW